MFKRWWKKYTKNMVLTGMWNEKDVLAICHEAWYAALEIKEATKTTHNKRKQTLKRSAVR